MRKFSAVCVALGVVAILFTACKEAEQKAVPAGQVEQQPAAPVEEMKKEAVQTVSAGESLFKLHCAVCHRDGGNIVNPQKTLSREDREKNGVTNVEDIVHVMRNPGPGMSKFDAVTIPDEEAKKIAEYVLNTFK
ncbi:MAG: c-type cytochrome [Nitrospiraceae bacterium]|nr:MAG: c-type cytochrome [Nitrospiraceae bacterium]